MHANTGTSEVWEPQVAAFSKAGYRVITFDRRGWGRSEADPATGAQPGHASEDLHALADYLLLRRFHLVGVAGGGFVALDYAAWHPDRLSSLVVGASTGSVSDGDSGLHRTDRDSRHPISAGALPRGERIVSRRQPRRHEALARDRTSRASAERASTATAIIQHVREAGGITTRTLVIAADADLLAPPALMRLWARHVKGAQWATVPDAGHAIAWEQPDVFNDIVLRFLKGGRPFPSVP